MLMESYLVEFSKIKKCITMGSEDFVVLSKKIFSLTEKKSAQPADLLSDNTPSNHPEALLLVNKDFARTLILNDDAFSFLKSSHIIDNLNGVTLHLAFASTDLVHDLHAVSVKKNMDGVSLPPLRDSRLNSLDTSGVTSTRRVTQQRLKPRRLASTSSVSSFVTCARRQYQTSKPCTTSRPHKNFWDTRQRK